MKTKLSTINGKLSIMKSFILSVTIFFASLSAMGQVCQIGTTGYATLDDALASITNNTHTTIKLLENIPFDGFYFDDRNITFDLNGYDLTVRTLTVINGSSIDYINPGNFLITLYARISDSSCKFTGLDMQDQADSGLTCENSTVTVTGDVLTIGQFASLRAISGSNVTVAGSVVSEVSVGGAVVCYDSEVAVKGDVINTYTFDGIDSENYYYNGAGVEVNNGKATIDGKIKAAHFLVLGSISKKQTDKEAVSSKPGYDEYYEDYYSIDSGTSTYSYAWVKTPLAVCEITAGAAELVGTLYMSLDDALAAITDNTQSTIKLLTNITNEPTFIWDRKITFDLNGYNLIFTGSGSQALTVEYGSIINYAGEGSFKAISFDNTGLAVMEEGASCTLTGVESKSDGADAVVCVGGTIVVNGNVTATGGYSVLAVFASYNCSITVNGDVTSSGAGISAEGEGASIAVNGNIKAYGNGANASGTGKIVITGNVTSSMMDGVDATDDGTTVNVNGDVIAAGPNSIGARAFEGAKITIEGKIDAQGYLIVGNENKTQADYTTPTTRTGYFTYTDGLSSVWVKNGANGISEIASKIDAYFCAGNLNVNSPAAETVQVYSITGIKVYEDKKDAGEKQISTGNLSRGAYIVKGSSGWVKKIEN